VKSAEYQSLLDSLPYGKRLPGAVYLLDPGPTSDALPAKLRVTVAELRKRLDIGPDFNLLKFHTASPKISFLAYPDFNKAPHPALAASIIVDHDPHDDRQLPRYRRLAMLSLARESARQAPNPTSRFQGAIPVDP
jgi:hypothetical protein